MNKSTIKARMLDTLHDLADGRQSSAEAKIADVIRGIVDEETYTVCCWHARAVAEWRTQGVESHLCAMVANLLEGTAALMPGGVLPEARTAQVIQGAVMFRWRHDDNTVWVNISDSGCINLQLVKGGDIVIHEPLTSPSQLAAALREVFGEEKEGATDG